MRQHEHRTPATREEPRAAPRPAAPAADAPVAVPATAPAHAQQADTPLGQTLARAVRERASGDEAVLARMPGLPTKKEAEKQGGKAGFHFGRGKTSYGRILETLALFRATTDKATAAQLLLQAQARSWAGL